MESSVSIRETEKKYCSVAMFAAIAVSVACIAAGYKPIGKSLILGTIFSIVNFVLMGETLPARIDKTRSEATLIALASIGFRYALMAIPLFMAVRSQEYNVFGVIVGIFMVQLMILGDHLATFIFSTRKQE